MKTIQEYFRSADKIQLAKEYLYQHPIDLMRIEDKERTVAEVLETAQVRLVRYIERLQSVEIEKAEQTGVLFVHKCIKDQFYEDAYSLVHLDELKRDGIKAATYAYELTEQNKIMGFLVSDARYTQKNITDLMIDVMFEASFFGFEQEYLKAERDIEQACREAEQGKSIPAKEYFDQLRRELGMEPEEPEFPDETEDELLHNAMLSIMEYDEYSKAKELTKLIRMIKAEGAGQSIFG